MELAKFVQTAGIFLFFSSCEDEKAQYTSTVIHLNLLLKKCSLSVIYGQVYYQDFMISATDSLDGIKHDPLLSRTFSGSCFCTSVYYHIAYVSKCYLIIKYDIKHLNLIDNESNTL